MSYEIMHVLAIAYCVLLVIILRSANKEKSNG